MLENEPQLVFLDTCVFITAGYNMGSRDLRQLEDLVAHGTVRIVTTDIVVREVRSRINLEVRAALARHAKLSKQSDVRILKAAEASRHLLAEANSDAVESELHSSFDDYLRRTKTLVLPTDDLLAGPVLTDYFQKNPPFGEGEKRKEFPDAFSIAAIRAWLQQNPTESLVVVTSDEGIAAGVTTIDRVEHVQRLSVFFNEVYSDDQAQARFLKHEVINRREDLKKWAADVFTDLGFDVSERWEAEVLEARVQRIEMTDDPSDLEIVTIGDGKATIVTVVDVDFEADIRYGDENMLDREDWVYWNHIEETVNERKEDIELEIRVSFDGLEAGRFEIDRVGFPGIEPVLVETSYDKESQRHWR